jgi:hypothetical protein
LGQSDTTFGTQNAVTLSLSVAGGNISLTNTQALRLFIVLSGTVPAGGFNLTFPIVGVYQLDTSQCTFASGGIINIIFGTVSAPISTPSVFTISLPVANTVTLIASPPASLLVIPISGATVTLTNAQALVPYLVITGTLAASFGVIFPIIGQWDVDTSQVTFAGHHLNMTSGSNSTQITTQNVFIVSIPVIGNAPVVK